MFPIHLPQILEYYSEYASWYAQLSVWPLLPHPWSDQLTPWEYEAEE